MSLKSSEEVRSESAVARNRDVFMAGSADAIPADADEFYREFTSRNQHFISAGTQSKRGSHHSPPSLRVRCQPALALHELERGRCLPYAVRAVPAAGVRGLELDREVVMKHGIALCLLSGILLAACGDDDDGGSSVDAAVTIDAPTADANPNAPDANPNAPDASIDAAPTGPVQEMPDCVGVFALTVTIGNEQGSQYVYSPDGERDKVPAQSIVRFETSARHDATSGSNSTSDGTFRVPLSKVTCLKFLEPGTYDFFCSVHPSIRGSITVVSAP